jgi:hypothetical protein
MTPRERAAELLKEELRTGKEEWYWISICHVKTGFVGVVVIPGRGPTDAWMRTHGLNLIPRDCETQTMGPLEADKVDEKVPESMRFRLLTKPEMEGADLI